jgi:hypothetical protein
VCILVMQRPGVYLKLLSNKALFIEKKLTDKPYMVGSLILKVPGPTTRPSRHLGPCKRMPSDTILCFAFAHPMHAFSMLFFLSNGRSTSTYVLADLQSCPVMSCVDLPMKP